MVPQPGRGREHCDMDSMLGGYCEEHARGRQHDLADLVVNGDVQNLWMSVKSTQKTPIDIPCMLAVPAHLLQIVKGQTDCYRSDYSLPIHL
jgi:hypothetical protein